MNERMPPDGYGVIARYGSYFLVQGIFYSQDLPHETLKGKLCKVTVLSDEQGVARPFESWGKAVEYAWSGKK